ncbi:MAG TPA: serine hydrolase domain-containing protein [Xanthomonadaceae bacterium]|jgi:D-alanyl-D-alanine carboxypeptidase|nr:serine hydrolase domain-containing protein [Xanthomonadaceae bacterium]
MRRIAIALCLLCACQMAAAADVVGPAQARRIGADVRDILRRTGTPGATIAIAVQGRVVYSHSWGLRDRERHLPATRDTHYEIGSITKQFTAAAILQLQEAGKLHIDDTLATYLPDAPHAGEVTLRQLLSHTSGMPNYFDAPDIERIATRPIAFDRLIALVAGKPLDFAPGSEWAYSNTGYILLGRVIELVSHESYRHYVQTHLLDPTGMSQTFHVAEETQLPLMAIGYRRRNGRTERAPTISDSFGWSAGHLVSTVDDLQKWNEALRNGRIVTAADYASMSTSVKTTDGADAGYGFGLFVDSIDDQPRVGHTGGSFGFTSADEYFPKQGLQIIAFTNNVEDPEPGERITTAIFEDLNPEIAAASHRPAPGEDPARTASLRVLFAGLQTGADHSDSLNDRLNGKLKTGLAQHLQEKFAPFGHPTAFVFKGQRSAADLQWFDYVIQFGPGSELKFSIGVDGAEKIASLSYG